MYNMSEMKINIMKLSDRAALPQYATAGSAGMDFTACIDSSCTIKPMQRALIPTGIAMSIPMGYGGFIYARSGLAIKHGITLSNCVGVIDSDYTGEIKIGLVNLSDADFTVNDGDRIAQIVIMPYEKAEFVLCDSLEATERGSGGFGSTGEKSFTFLEENLSEG